MFFFSENVAKNDDLAGALTEYPRKIQNPGVIKTRVKRGVLEDENISFLNFSNGPKTSQILHNFKAIHLWKKEFCTFILFPSLFFLASGKTKSSRRSMHGKRKAILRPPQPRNLSAIIDSFFFLFISVFGKLRLNLFQNLVFTPTSTCTHIISSLLCLRQTVTCVQCSRSTEIRASQFSKFSLEGIGARKNLPPPTRRFPGKKTSQIPNPKVQNVPLSPHANGLEKDLNSL